MRRRRIGSHVGARLNSRRFRLGRMKLRSVLTVAIAASVLIPTIAYGVSTSVPAAATTTVATTTTTSSSAPTRTGIPFDASAAASANVGDADPMVCEEDGPYDPPVSQNELSWVAVESANEVEMVNEATGAVYGSPIGLPSGSDPVSIAFWQPSPGSGATTSDPIVITANSNDTVSFIDTVTKVVLSTLSLGGSGTNPSSIAASTTSDFAAVADTASSEARVQMIDVATRAIVKTFASVASGSNLISQLIFDPSGVWVDAAAPSVHKIFSFEQTSSTSPYFTEPSGSTYTGASSFDPVGLAADETTSTATDLYVTSNGSSQKLWDFTNDPPSSPTSLHTYADAPGAVALSPGGADAYVQVPTAGDTDVLTLTGTITNSWYATTTTPGAIAVNEGTGMVYVGDGSSGATDMKLYNWAGSTPTFTLQSTSTLAGIATSIATPIPDYIHYDIFALVDSSIEIVDSSTGVVVQTINDVNDPVSVVPSPDGREVYVVNEDGSGSGGSEPQVQVISTRALGTSNAPITATYAIPQSASSPFSYSLTNMPIPVQAALSPSGDTLLITDSANSKLLSVDVGPFDAHLGHVIGDASLNGSTAETPESITITPDGTNAYVAVQPAAGGVGGITNFAFTSSTLAYGSADYQAGSSLSDSDSNVLKYPSIILTSNDGKSIYVLDTNATAPLLFQFPRNTSGTLANESQTALPAGTDPEGFSLSPEDAVAYISDHDTEVTSALDLSSGTVAYTSAGDVVPGWNAVTPDGQYFAVSDADVVSEECITTGVDGLSIYSSADGSDLFDVELGGGHVDDGSKPGIVVRNRRQHYILPRTTRLAGTRWRRQSFGVRSLLTRRRAGCGYAFGCSRRLGRHQHGPAILRTLP